MTNLNKRQHDLMYPQVVARQGGEFCIACGRDKNSLMRDGNKPKFCLDCINNSGDHSKPEYLQLLCYSCNTAKNHPETTIPFTRTATPEMSAGKRYESDFRRWVNGQYLVNENIGLEYSFLVNSGAEKVGCSTETIKRYLHKMTSSEGMYDWNDRYGSVLLVLKDEYKNG